MNATIITGPTAAARAEFVEWLRGVLAATQHAERHADAAIAEHDWGRGLSLEIRGRYTRTGTPMDYEFHPSDMAAEVVGE